MRFASAPMIPCEPAPKLRRPNRRWTWWSSATSSVPRASGSRPSSKSKHSRSSAGTSAFWQAHDYLYKHRDALAQGKLTPDAVAAELHLDLSAFREATSSLAVATRVAEDIDQAKLCDIKGT